MWDSVLFETGRVLVFRSGKFFKHGVLLCSKKPPELEIEADLQSKPHGP